MQTIISCLIGILLVAILAFADHTSGGNLGYVRTQALGILILPHHQKAIEQCEGSYSMTVTGPPLTVTNVECLGK